MFAVWYFDGEFPGEAPQRVYTGPSAGVAFEALCLRFGAHLFDEAWLMDKLEASGPGFVQELPGDSRLAIVKQ